MSNAMIIATRLSIFSSFSRTLSSLVLLTVPFSLISAIERSMNLVVMLFRGEVYYM